MLLVISFSTLGGQEPLKVENFGTFYPVLGEKREILWTPTEGGKWELKEGVYTQSDGDSYYYLVSNLNLADFSLRLKVKFQHGWYPVFLVCRTGLIGPYGSDGCTAFISRNEGLSLGPDFSLRGKYSLEKISLQTEQWYDVYLKVIDNQVSLKVWETETLEPDEFQINSIIPELPKSGKLGIGCRNVCSFKNLEIKEEIKNPELSTKVYKDESGEIVVSTDTGIRKSVLRLPALSQQTKENTITKEFYISNLDNEIEKIKVLLFATLTDLKGGGISFKNWEWIFFDLNGHQWVVKPEDLPLVQNKGKWADWSSSYWSSIEVPFPGGILKKGINTLTIWNNNLPANPKDYYLETGTDECNSPMVRLSLKLASSPERKDVSIEKRLGYSFEAVNSLTKILPSSYQRTYQKEINLLSATNEYESAQIVVIGKEKSSRVHLCFSDLVTENRKSQIPATCIEGGPIYYINSGSDNFWPDVVSYDGAATIMPGQIQPFCVTVYVPKSTPAGIYKGLIQIVPDNLETSEISLMVKVLNFEIPDATHLQFIIGLGVDKRIPVSYHLFNFSCGEGDPQPEYILKENGEIEVNFEAYDREMERLLARGDKYISLGMCLFDGAGPTFGRLNRAAINEKTGEKCSISLNPLEGEGERKNLASVLRQFEKHLKEKGWLDKVYIYLSDEVREPKYVKMLEEAMKCIKQAAPPLKIAIIGGELTDAMLPYVTSYTVMMNHFQPESIDRLRKSNIELWWYSCGNLNNPSLCIPHPAIDIRIYPWMNWKWKIPVTLNWASFVAKYDRNKYSSGDGDGELFYEDEQGRIYPSSRALLLRDGLEDNECFWILDNLVEEATKKGFAKETIILKGKKLLVIPDNLIESQFKFNRDPSALLSYREEVMLTIEHIKDLLQR